MQKIIKIPQVTQKLFPQELNQAYLANQTIVKKDYQSKSKEYQLVKSSPTIIL